MAKLLHSETTGKILNAAFEVYNHLGYGFLEKVYQRAMQVELIQNGCQCEYEAQLLNELKATGILVGMLINFGKTTVEYKRMVY